MASAANQSGLKSKLLAGPRHAVRWVRGAPLTLKLVLALVVLGTAAARVE